MKKFLAFAIIVVAFFSIKAITVDNDRYFEILKNMEIFSNVYKELNANYVDDVDPGEMMKIGLDAMTNALDPYTNYISEAQVENYRISTMGKYEGIGAVIKTMGDYVTIIDAYESSPALKAGMRIGDQIVSINGMSTKGKNNEDVQKIFRGVPGTKVDMIVNRPGVKDGIKIELTREEVSVPNVPHAEMVSEDVAYVVLTTFTQDASANIRKELSKLKKENPDLKGVILDLRNNGGGLLREAIDVSNLFIPQGLPVVSTKGKVAERDRTYSTTKASWDTEIPLAVLINKSSASASEIVSGVIQDYDRGVLIGQRSFGKGLVQNTTEVGYNSRLKLTTSKYYIPSNRCIQSVEYENGEPKDIADERRTKFKTRNGRIVLDGGGVTPDVKLELKNESEFAKSLKEENIIFNYVTTFVNAHDEITGPTEFEFKEYDDFVKFAQSTNFEFKSSSQKLLEELQEKAQVENIEANNEIQTLQNHITSFYKDSFQKYKDEVVRLIEEEIVNRYYFEQGKVAYQLAKDHEIDEAIKVLLSDDYNRILAGN